MRPESELEAEEVAFVNTCRLTFERLEALHRGRSELMMEVTTPAGTQRFWCHNPVEFIPPEVPVVTPVEPPKEEPDAAPVVETRPMTDAEFLAEVEAGEPNGPSLRTDGITDTPFPPGELILRGPGSEPPQPKET